MTRPTTIIGQARIAALSIQASPLSDKRDDVYSAMKRVIQAGGKVLGEPIKIPGVGRYISFFDTEGNRVSMLQPNVT